ncbi:50S ribosomal protein L33 [Streptacidiphilus anmyonensis]|uniref:50S ribosomal protein L33 n=1 Tax=Streptacidiphilus anmyonensis TaxID=405782 RepID=UPI0005A5F328|nr:50S ribosomal protein L33 [Streptacidiphilus anmyonensis]
MRPAATRFTGPASGPSGGCSELRSTAGTGYTSVTRKNRRNDPDRLVLRKHDPVLGRHTEFCEER